VRYVLHAPPGFGKSRLIARLAAGRRSLIFVRSHVEGLQMARYVAEHGGDAGVLFGRRHLCPFKAENWAQCFELRESGKCKAKSRRVDAPIFDVDELYKMGVCPYEALHVEGRRKGVVVLPLAYLSKVSNISAVADLFEEVEFVALDEAHNLLSTVEVSDEELYSRRYCIGSGGGLTCLVLPLVGEVAGRARFLLAASASIVRQFSDIFTYFLRAEYIEIQRLPGEENLDVDYMPLKIRYRTRLKRQYVDAVVDKVRQIFREYRRAVVFLPNKELASLYASKIADLPVSDQPLGDIDHIIVTYYGSPISEGVNLNVKAGVLVGFPIPDVSSRELWEKVKILKRLGFDGYKYGVLFTAVNHVVQAAGRVMRGLDRERKYILLIDDRFAEYRAYLPQYLSRAVQ
jgi:Rad3-related DNA helicase